MSGLIRFFVRFNLVGDLLMIAILSGFVDSSIQQRFFLLRSPKRFKFRSSTWGTIAVKIEEGIVAKIEENLKGSRHRPSAVCL